VHDTALMRHLTFPSNLCDSNRTIEGYATALRASNM